MAQKILDYSRKVIFSIFAIAILGSVSFSYAVPDIWTAATTTNVGSTTMLAVSMSEASNGVAVGNSGTIIFTTNGGVDWTLATTTNVGSAIMDGVSMSDANNGVAVGGNGIIVFTTNGGVDWTAATTTSVGTAQLSEVSMSDANNGVAVGQSGTIVFTDCAIETAADVNTIISSNCTVRSDVTAGGSVRVESGAVMTIPNGVTLDINFATKNLTVESGSGVLIVSGGKIT